METKPVETSLLLTITQAKYFIDRSVYILVVGSIPIEFFGAQTLKPIYDYIRSHNLTSLIDEHQTLVIRGKILDVESLPFSVDDNDKMFFVINSDGELESFPEITLVTDYIEEQIEQFDYDITEFMVIFGHELTDKQVKYICKRIRGENNG